MACTEDTIDWNCECNCCNKRNSIVRDLMAEYNGIKLADEQRISELEAEVERLQNTVKIALGALRKWRDVDAIAILSEVEEGE